MSITFFVKNKKKFLVGLAPVMSVEEALRLVPNLSQFNADEDDEEFDADGFYGAKLSELDCLVAGTDGLSGRGFEIGSPAPPPTPGFSYITPRPPATRTAHITSASARQAPARTGKSR